MCLIGALSYVPYSSVFLYTYFTTNYAICFVCVIGLYASIFLIGPHLLLSEVFFVVESYP